VIVAAVISIIVVAVVAAYFLVLHKPSEGAPSFTISVSPKSLSVARGGSGTLTVTLSPAEYGSNIGSGLTVWGAPPGVRVVSENATVQGGVSPNSFNYIFGVVENAPENTYTVTLTVTTMVPSPWLTASDNFTLIVT